jgi:hypothetical protein
MDRTRHPELSGKGAGRFPNLKGLKAGLDGLHTAHGNANLTRQANVEQQNPPGAGNSEKVDVSGGWR